MSKIIRMRYSAEFNAEMALEAIKNDLTLVQLET
jgi:hypothetical protein